MVESMTTTAPTVEVTVKHIPLTKETYEELLEALDELDRAFKRATAESVNARRWLHYRWLVEQSAQAECHQ
jgi:hypothetical protein